MANITVLEMQMATSVLKTPPLVPILALDSYLVMPFMGTDLGKLMKMERLCEDRVQFLVYQMLRGLKVRKTSEVTKPKTFDIRIY